MPFRLMQVYTRSTRQLKRISSTRPTQKMAQGDWCCLPTVIWTITLGLRDMPKLVSRCHEQGHWRGGPGTNQPLRHCPHLPACRSTRLTPRPSAPKWPASTWQWPPPNPWTKHSLGTGDPRSPTGGNQTDGGRGARILDQGFRPLFTVRQLCLPWIP